jgi:hypothetical protein
MNTPAVSGPSFYADSLGDLRKNYRLGSEIFLPTSEKYGPEARYRGVVRARDCFERLYPRVYRSRLERLRGGRAPASTCVILGNGPSLQHVELDRLRHVPTFAANGIYLAYPGTSFRPTFHVVEDHLVAEDRAGDLNRLHESIKLFPTYLAYCMEDDGATIFYRHLIRPRAAANQFDFSPDASECTYAGCTVTFSSLQLAYYLGFRRILLTGLDHNYALPVDVQQRRDYNVAVLDMKSDDPNHFNKDYFGKGKRWHDPQVEKMNEAYVCAREFFQCQGVEIYNCTVGGKLEVFPRARLEDCLAQIPPAEFIEPGAWRRRLVAETSSPPPSTRVELLSLRIRDEAPAAFKLVRETHAHRFPGWHQVVDHTWLVEQLWREVPLRSTVLEASGDPLLPFVLAEAGYNVVALAPKAQLVSPRLAAAFADRLFSLDVPAASGLAAISAEEALLPFPNPRIFFFTGQPANLPWRGERPFAAVVSCARLACKTSAALATSLAMLRQLTAPGGWHFHTVPVGLADAPALRAGPPGARVRVFSPAGLRREWGVPAGAPDNFARLGEHLAEFADATNYLAEAAAAQPPEKVAHVRLGGRWSPPFVPAGVAWVVD